METVLHAMESGAGAPLAFGGTLALGLAVLLVGGAVRRIRRPLVAALAPVPAREDAWAVPGITYYCGPKCSFHFRLLTDGTWEKDDEYGIRRVLPSWDDVVDQYGDCTTHLIRRYGKMEP